MKLPGTKTFVDVTPGQAIPPGTVVDVSNGAGIELTDSKGDELVLYGERDGVPSVFVVQKPVGGITELRLTGGDFKACAKRALQAAKAKKPVQRLWAKGKGKFATRGRYASTSIRGTWWLTADFCDRTLVSVKQGVVAVRDLVKKKTVVVKAGGSYSAKP